jgi:hypothetical protein
MKLYLFKLYLKFRQLELQAGQTSGLNEKRMRWLETEIATVKELIKREEFKQRYMRLLNS